MLYDAPRLSQIRRASPIGEYPIVLCAYIFVSLIEGRFTDRIEHYIGDKEMCK